MYGRSSAALVVVVLVAARAASAAPLTEAEVIRLVRAASPEVAAARAETAIARAAVVEAGLLPNPELAWEREALPGSGSEDELALALPLDVSGRRPARRALARAALASARARAARSTSAAVERALAAFYEAVATGRRVQIARTMTAELAEAARVVRRRHEEGTVAGYERHRAEIARELAASELSEAEARAEVAHRVLALLLGRAPEELVVAGDLAPAPAAAVDAPPATEARPSLVHARRSVTEAERARARARWAWLPTVTLAGGPRVVRSDGDTDRGYVAGVAVTLPLFAHGQELRAAAAAETRRARAAVRIAAREAEIDATEAAVELAAARAELGRFEAATGERLVRLERAVTSGYREGTRSLVELLDAARTRAAAERRRLALALAAKRAELALRAARGEFE